MNRSILTLVIVPILLFIGCEPTERNAMEREADSLAIVAQEEMIEFRADVDETLADIDTKIDSLEVYAELAADEMSVAIDSTVASLRERRDAVQQDLQQLEMATEDAYDDARADVEAELNELETDVQMAWERYRNDDADPDAS